MVISDEDVFVALGQSMRVDAQGLSVAGGPASDDVGRAVLRALIQTQGDRLALEWRRGMLAFGSDREVDILTGDDKWFTTTYALTASLLLTWLDDDEDEAAMAGAELVAMYRRYGCRRAIEDNIDLGSAFKPPRFVEAMWQVRVGDERVKGYQLVSAGAVLHAVGLKLAVARTIGYLSAVQTSSAAGRSGNLSELTARESEILLLMATGATTSSIAQTLSISPHTVKRHTSNIYSKLGTTNRSQTVAAAFQAGLVSLNAGPGPAA